MTSTRYDAEVLNVYESRSIQERMETFRYKGLELRYQDIHYLFLLEVYILNLYSANLHFRKPAVCIRKIGLRSNES